MKKDLSTNNYAFPTKAVHSGEERKKFADSIIYPIVQTSTFVFHDTEDISNYTSGKKLRYEYGRYGNPTQQVTEQKLAELEGTEDGLLFSSGMSAITSTLLTFLSEGHHIVITDDAYKKTLYFCKDVLPRFGIECTSVPPCDYRALRNAIKDNTTIIFSESPTNPYLNVLDLKEVVKIAKENNIILIIDSTLATPYNQKPLEFGVDLVIHSATKYLGGHNDLLAGVVLGNTSLVSPIRALHKTLGGILDPHCCYLLLRGLKTFALRMEYQNNSTQRIAEFLEKHPKIKRVYYPGLASHPHYKIAKEQMKGFGGVVTFEVDGNLKIVEKFLNSLQLCFIAPSLGGVETLITHPASVTYYDMSRNARLEMGIKDELIRLSVGIEDTNDIIKDLEQALEKAGKIKKQHKHLVCAKT